MKYSVDVIIPTYKPGKKFQQLLERLEKQEYPINRIIVVNTEKEYYPQDEIKAPACMELYHITEEEFDHGTTRNLAAKKSNADFLLFMTQDAVPADSKLVGELVAAFEDETVGAAYAKQIPNKQHSAIEKFTRYFNYPAKSRVKRKKDIEELGIKTFFCSDVCAMYRRSLYEAFGGFMPQAIFNEDMLFASKLIYEDYAIAYQATAKVIHSHDYTGWEQLQRNFDNGVSQTMNEAYLGNVRTYGEGIRLVKATLQYLVKHGYKAECIRLIYLSACKVIGFKLGTIYYKLPKALVMRLTMNKRYWN